MRPIVFGSSLIAGLACGLSAHATAYSLDGLIDTYTVPTTGIYDILAIGAAGGSNEASEYASALPGGEGASVEGLFSLTQGTVLDILVGAQGTTGFYSGGGGGGSFVVTVSGTPLAVAGGGGGSGWDGSGNTGSLGSSGSSELNADLVNGLGGSNGAGGSSPSGDQSGGGGGGLSGNGGSSTDAGGGLSFLAGGAGGAALVSQAFYQSTGGFGGGGDGYFGNGGGGGGYSGGGGGGGIYGDWGGGGGGSYLDASAVDPVVTLATQADGSVTITLDTPTDVPEPASIALLGAGLILLGLTRPSRRSAHGWDGSGTAPT